MYLKAIRITKKMLKMDPARLLVSLGLFDDTTKTVKPGNLYISYHDEKIMVKNLRGTYRKEFKKQHFYSSKSIKANVAMTIFNYGPNSALRDALKPGWGVVVYED